MKVKDLSLDLVSLKLILPDEHLELYKAYVGGEKEMYLIGHYMGDFFVSPDPPSTKKRRLYPLPPALTPQSVLEWEVADPQLVNIIQPKTIWVAECPHLKVTAIKNPPTDSYCAGCKKWIPYIQKTI